MTGWLGKVDLASDSKYARQEFETPIEWCRCFSHLYVTK